MWKITYDWFDKKKRNIESADFDQEKWNALPANEKVKIKLYDDDDQIMFDGVTSDLNKSESKAFAPLDWAAYDSGCTYMKYKDPVTKEWKVL